MGQIASSDTGSAALGTKFSIGEITDFVGVPDYYDAGDSKWMKTNAWVSSDLLPTEVVQRLRSSFGTTTLTDNALINEATQYIAASLPAAIVGTTRAMAYSSGPKGTQAHAFVVNDSGAQVVAIGQTTGYNQNGGDGGGNTITSDGAKFYSWTGTASGFALKTSLTGLSWASEALSGLPVFSHNNMPINMMGSQNHIVGMGEQFEIAGGIGGVMAMYCGARHLLIGLSATGGAGNLIASRSVNGTTFAGDESVAVLGTATQSSNGIYQWFYRNGNNVFLTAGSVVRKTTDGGVTWATPANAISAGGNRWFRPNSSDPARIFATQNTTAAASSSDSGSTWTPRTLPVAGNSDYFLFGRGADWIYTANGTAYLSTDDGATWAPLPTIPGLGPITAVYADANRWYALSLGGNQVAVSTDRANWTVRNIGNKMPAGAVAPKQLVSIDANTIMGVYDGNALYSTDGGVTWAWSSVSSASVAHAQVSRNLVPITQGGGLFVSGVTYSSTSGAGLYIPKANLAASGKAVRVGSATVAPSRTNAFAYARVA